jgi:uracil-DNA glycosylase
MRVTRDRGRPLDTPLAPIGAVTIHPSAVLRVADRDERQGALGEMVEDLSAIAKAVGKLSRGEMTRA